MKIAMMGGAYINAGDFLIEKRSRDLLEKVFEDAQIDLFKRNVSFDDQIDTLNSYDLIVFAGGPGFQRFLYPTYMPFVSDLSKITVPIRILGWGSKCFTSSDKNIYENFRFEPQMKGFISYVSKDNQTLGCRDWYTCRILNNEGFKNYVMTGCPAWYDVEKIDNLSLKLKTKLSELGKDSLICISDNANPKHNEVFIETVKSVVRLYPDTKIKVIYHRGMKEDTCEIVKSLSDNIEILDISGSVDGFSLYNECDLHIGFRVHAHIYNLSQGKVSILLNEDTRGAGVNHALGIENLYFIEERKVIKNYLIKKKTKIETEINIKHLSEKIRDYIEYIDSTDYLQYKRAFESMKEYYKVMIQFIKTFEV